MFFYLCFIITKILFSLAVKIFNNFSNKILNREQKSILNIPNNDLVWTISNEKVKQILYFTLSKGILIICNNTWI